MINDPSLLPRVGAWLRTPDAFWGASHKKIWKALSALNRDNATIDGVLLHHYLREHYGDETASEVSGLLSEAATSENIEHYARIIWQSYLRRRLVDAGRQLSSLSTASDNRISDILRQQQQWLDEFNNLQPSRSRDIEVLANEAVESLSASNDIIPFGISYLDDFAGGMTRGEITTFGGRPGHGKTTMMINIIDALAAQGRKVMVFNREMTNTQCIGKLMVLNSPELTVSDFRRLKRDDRFKENIKVASQILKERYKNLIMYDDIRDLGNALREIQRHEPDVIIDDYIQLIEVNSKQKDRRFEIERVMLDYKWILKRIGASAVLVSQLSRDIEKRLEQTPAMSDFAEGASIEHLSENLIVLFYGYNFNSEDYSPYDHRIYVKKARYGRIGTYNIGYYGNKCRFFLTADEARHIASQTKGAHT